MKKPPLTENALADLLTIARDLRDKNGGCPWDLEQTHKSLAKNLLEEASELVEVIEVESPKLSDDDLKEELGDVLFQVVIHAQLASETGRFTFDDVARTVANKLTTRHPHVYGDLAIYDTEGVLNNWEAVKRRERERKQARVSALDGVPKALAALQRATRLGEKAARVGFDWAAGSIGQEQVRQKVHEELAEFEAAQSESLDRATEELGDLLFALAQYARKLGIDAEGAARAACNKFETRFRALEPEAEALFAKNGTLSENTWESLWNKVKAREITQ